MQTSVQPKRQTIIRLRLEAGLTQTELAEKAGVTFSAVSRLENGHTASIRPSTAKKLAAALKVEIAEIAYLPAADPDEVAV